MKIIILDGNICFFCMIFRHFEERHLAHLEYIFKKESIIWGNYLPWLLVDERSCKKGGWVKAVANSSRPLISRQRHKSFWLHLLSFPHQIQKKAKQCIAIKTTLYHFIYTTKVKKNPLNLTLHSNLKSYQNRSFYNKNASLPRPFGPRLLWLRHFKRWFVLLKMSQMIGILVSLVGSRLRNFGKQWRRDSGCHFGEDDLKQIT